MNACLVLQKKLSPTRIFSYLEPHRYIPLYVGNQTFPGSQKTRSIKGLITQLIFLAPMSIKVIDGHIFMLPWLKIQL